MRRSELPDLSMTDNGSDTTATSPTSSTAPDLAHLKSPVPALQRLTAAPHTGRAVSKGHAFLLRPLVASDLPFIAELAQYSYDGRDFILNDFDAWMQSREPHAPLALALVYEGRAGEGGEGEAEKAPFIGHVIAIETMLLLDSGCTGWLYSLRVHPVFRSLSLSSLLHSYLIHEAKARPGIRRLRETTHAENSGGLHIARKHGFSSVTGAAWAWLHCRDDWQQLVQRLHRRLLQRGIDVRKAALRQPGSAGVMAAGSVSDVLQIVSSRSQSSVFSHLLQYWIAYDMTEANVAMLTADHQLTVSYADDGTLAAFSVAKDSRDYSGNIQTFTVYCDDVEHLLLHLYYQLDRQRGGADSAGEEFLRVYYFVPSAMEKLLEGEIEGWKPDMHLLLMEMKLTD